MIDPRGEADGFISDYWLDDDDQRAKLRERPAGVTTAESVLELDRAAIIMRHLLRLLAERDCFPTEVDE